MEPYFEKELIINNRRLVHKGIFCIDDLMNVINRSLQERGYEKREKKSEETVSEEGRKIHLELRPFKVKRNDFTLMIKIKISSDKITEVMFDFDGVKRKAQQGELEIVFDAWVLTDLQNRWSMKPWFYFLKGVINKYIYTFPTEAGFPGELAGDTAYVYGKIKNLLRSYKEEKKDSFKEKKKKLFQEEEVISKVEQEILGDTDERNP